MSPFICIMIWIEITIKLALIFALLIFIIPFGLSGVRGAFFAPSDTQAIQRMITMLNIHAGETIVDIGSGDGRIVIALAKRGAHAIGIERNLWLVWYARLRVRLAGLTDHATIVHANLWDFSFTQVHGVTLFGIPYIMKPLEHKLRTELPLNARVVSNRFTFPTWTSAQSQHNIHLYIQSV